jgi:hypothetical protein
LHLLNYPGERLNFRLFFILRQSKALVTHLLLLLALINTSQFISSRRQYQLIFRFLLFLFIRFLDNHLLIFWFRGGLFMLLLYGLGSPFLGLRNWLWNKVDLRFNKIRLSWFHHLSFYNIFFNRFNVFFFFHWLILFLL